MRRFFIIAGSLCFLLSVLFLTLTPQVLGQDGETLLKEVQAALETQDYPRTISLADKALAALPGSSEAFRMRGNAYRGLKDLQKALSDYDRAVQLDNRSYRAFAGRALVRLMMKEHDKALQDADKALALKVDYGAGYSIRGEILIAQKQYKQAIKDLDESLRLLPNNSGSLFLRGNARYESADYQGAVADYNAAEKLNPNRAGLFYNRGLAGRKLKDHAQAEKDFTRAIEMGYRVAEAYAQRGTVALERGDQAKANQDLAKARELDPKIKMPVAVKPAGEKAVAAAPSKPAPAQEPLRTAAPLSATRASDLSAAASPQPPAPPEPRPEKIQAPGVLARMDDPCGQITLPEGEETDTPSLPPPAPVDPGLLQTPLAQNINKLTRSRYAAIVTAGREAMEMLLGPLPPAKEKEFQAAWALMADYPSQKVVAYLDRLNPLLAEFLALTQACESLLAAYEQIRFEAEMAAAYEHEPGTREALEQAGLLAGELRTIKQRLEQVAAKVKALGDPPNPLEDKCRARKKARKALTMFQPGGSWVLTGKNVTQVRWRKEDSRITKSEAKFSVNSAVSTTVVPSKFMSTTEAWPDYVNQWRYFWSQPPQVLAGGDKVRMEAILEDTGCSYADMDPYVKIWLVSDRHIADTVLWNGMIGSWAPDRKINGLYRTLVVEARGAGGTKKYTPQELSKFSREGIRTPAPPQWKPVSTNHNRFWPVLLKGEENWRFTLEVELHSQYITAVALYEYQWDPTAPPPPPGQAIPINLPGNLAAALKAPASPAQASTEKPSAGPTPEQLLKQKVAFHQNNIKFLEDDIRRYQEMLNKVRDEGGRQALQFTLSCKLADLQAEHDAIATLTTGNFTRTRTPFDEMVSAQMAANSRELAARINEENHRRGTLDRLIKLLPPSGTGDHAPMGPQATGGSRKGPGKTEEGSPGGGK